MQDAPISHITTQTLKKKVLKNQILEEIRIYLSIPNDVPRGGTEFVMKLKEIGTKRQQMAIDHIKPLYDQLFRGRLTIQKLHRWAMSNGKIHKRCLLQSEETKQYVFEEVKRMKERGLTNRMIVNEIAKIVGKEVSRSTLARWIRECSEFNFDQGTKRVKMDTLYQDGDQNEILTLNHSPNLENYYDFEPQNSLESCFYDDETYFMEMDAWRSISLLSKSAESMAAIDNLYQELNA